METSTPSVGAYRERRRVPGRMAVFRSLGLLLVLLCAGGRAAEVTITDESRHPLSNSVYVFEGPDLDWRQVADKPLSEGLRNDGYILNTDRIDLPAWARIDLSTGDLPASEKWLLNGGNAFGGRITFYVLRNGELVDEIHADSFESFHARPVDHPTLMFPVTLEPNSRVQLLLKLEKMGMPYLVPSLVTEKSFLKTDRQQIIMLGIQIGIVLALMIYHVMLASATFDRTFFLYSLYIGANALFGLSYYGVGYQYLWPDSPRLAVYVSQTSFYLPTFFGILFTVSFLNLGSLSRRFVRYFQTAFALLGSLVLIRVTTGKLDAVYLTWAAMVVYLSFMVAGVYALLRGVVYARFFLIAWSLYFVALINWLLMVSGTPALLPDKSFMVLEFSYDAQIFLLSLALAHRIRTLRTSAMEAEADSRAKTAFLARMSHEIRTPLSGVLGMSELLAGRLKGKTDIYYNNIIRTSGKSLLTIIDDILDYSKFSSGKMQLESITFDIRRLAMDCLDVFKARAAEKDIQMVCELDPELPTWVRGDPTRLKQIMLNFISNAIKFTPSGRVSLEIAPVRQNMIRVAVSDTGEGIPENEQCGLFEPFAQANRTTSRTHGGTGLGLSICKQLALLMGGKIGVDSAPGQGSTFWVTVGLPASTEDDCAGGEAGLEFCSGEGIPPLKLLVVEDNPVNQVVVRGILERLNQQPDVVADGEDAIEKLIAEGKRYDLILMDCEMERMDGVTATRKLRQWEADNGLEPTPVVALTAHAVQTQIELCSEAGMNAYLTKPIEVDKLENLIRNYANGRCLKGFEAPGQAAAETA